MITFGIILAADDITIDNKSVYLCKLGEWSILNMLAREMDKSTVREWAVVLGHDNDLHRRDIENISIRCVFDSQWEKGFASHALKGLNEMPPHADGFIILPGNIPFFTQEIMDAMAECLASEKGFIIVPAINGQRFPYPLLHRKYLGEIRRRLNEDNFFEIADDHPAETYELKLDSEESILRINDENDLAQAREINYRRTEGDDQSNPQARIPQ
jgi:CTP:molybdopterin cytidylyltransferase MocA